MVSISVGQRGLRGHRLHETTTCHLAVEYTQSPSSVETSGWNILSQPVDWNRPCQPPTDKDACVKVLTLYLAARDPRVPRAAKLVSFMVAAYALSPIDLIPDFIPVLGYVDDLVIVP